MNRYLPLLATFLIFAGVTGALFFALWASWVGPARIRHAVAQRLGPRRIQAAVKASYVYWLLMLLFAAIVAGVIAYLSWLYLGLWLYDTADSWQDGLATTLNQTLWVLELPGANPNYQEIVPVGIVVCVLLGVYAGALLGTWAGTLLAAKRYLITRAMF
jgi:hypothetical protein